MYRGVFTVGVVVTRGKGLTFADALTDYSYIINVRNEFGIRLARCLTGLGPSSNDNGALGGLYFNGNMVPNSASCYKIHIQPRPGDRIAGVINIDQCNRVFTTDNEGVYTCAMMNSSMMNESVRFGIYLNGKSESLDLIIYPIT